MPKSASTYTAARALTSAGIAGLLVAACSNPDEIHNPSPPTPTIEASLAPTAGLIGEWKLDGNGTDTKSGNNATIAGGAVFVSSPLGSALDLDNDLTGTGPKYAQIPSAAALDTVQRNNYSISAWFKPYTRPPDDSLGNRFWTVVAKPNPDMGLVYNKFGKFVVRHYLTGNVLQISPSAGVYAINAWHHVVGTVNRAAGTIKVYVNGTLDGTVAFSTGTAAAEYGTTAFRIGKTDASWAADGQVDQVRVYNRELTAEEVDSLHTETAASAPTVVTETATNILSNAATLRGSANPNGSTSTGWFRYATENPTTCNNTFGLRHPASGGDALGSGSTSVAYSERLTGLAWGKTYYYCAVASNTVGIGLGEVRSFKTPFRYAVSMSKESTDDMGFIAASTPDGKFQAVGTNLRTVLQSARAMRVRVIVKITGDNANFFVAPSDHRFDIQKWKLNANSAFNSTAFPPESVRTYMRDGTLIGHYALDEPFKDFTNFTSAQAEAVCEYQKASTRWPFVPCFIRSLNTELEEKSNGSDYQYLDAGWVQLDDHHFNNDPTLNGSYTKLYEREFAAGARVKLALVLGFNLLNGGNNRDQDPDVDPTCFQTDTNGQCGLRPAEIDSVTDAVVRLNNAPSPLRGCALNGWQLTAAEGDERDYYKRDDVQTALRRMFNLTAAAGMVPGLCTLHNLQDP